MYSSFEAGFPEKAGQNSLDNEHDTIFFHGLQALFSVKSKKMKAGVIERRIQKFFVA
jgi:hypothetical protein